MNSNINNNNEEVENDDEQQHAIPEKWINWLRINVARGCNPQDLIDECVEEQKFCLQEVQKHIDNIQDEQQQFAFPEEWINWISINLSRGCNPQDLIDKCVNEQSFCIHEVQKLIDYIQGSNDGQKFVFTEEWMDWLRINLSRGCNPQDLIDRCVNEHNFCIHEVRKQIYVQGNSNFNVHDDFFLNGYEQQDEQQQMEQMEHLQRIFSSYGRYAEEVYNVVQPYIKYLRNIEYISEMTEIEFLFDIKAAYEEEEEEELGEGEQRRILACTLRVSGTYRVSGNNPSVTSFDLDIEFPTNNLEYYDNFDPVHSVGRLIAMTVEQLKTLSIRISPSIDLGDNWMPWFCDERSIFWAFADGGHWSQTLEELIMHPCCHYGQHDSDEDNGSIDSNDDNEQLKLPNYLSKLPTKPNNLKKLSLFINEAGDDRTVNRYLKFFPALEDVEICIRPLFLDECFNLLDMVRDLHNPQHNNCNTIKSIRIIHDDIDLKAGTSLVVNENDLPAFLNVLEGLPNLDCLTLRSDSFKSSFVDAMVVALPRLSSLSSIFIKGGETMSDNGLDAFLDYVLQPSSSILHFRFDFHKMHKKQRKKTFQKFAQTFLSEVGCSEEYFDHYDANEYEMNPNRGHKILEFLFSLVQLRPAFLQMDVTTSDGDRNSISPYKLWPEILQKFQITLLINRPQLANRYATFLNRTDITYALLRQRPEFLLCAPSTGNASTSTTTSSTATGPPSPSEALEGAASLAAAAVTVDAVTAGNTNGNNVPKSCSVSSSNIFKRHHDDDEIQQQRDVQPPELQNTNDAKTASNNSIKRIKTSHP